MNESKAEAERMTNKNGSASADRFSIVADQIKTAATQLRNGRTEPPADSGSVALNQAVAETQAGNAEAPPPRPPITTPRGNSLNRDHSEPSQSEASSPIDLFSAVDDGPSERRPARTTGKIINLPNAAAETPILRPTGGPRPIVGSAGARTKEPISEAIGEAFPEHVEDGLALNGDSRASEEPQASFGMFLLGARERRGVKREEAAHATRIPVHYLRMLESNDYAMIADQLYLLPFLRRYADYLELDSEEVAIRFVREVQRSENGPAPVSLGVAGNSDAAPSNRWAIIGAIAVIGLIAVWIILQHDHAPADASSASQTQTASQETDSSEVIPATAPPAAALRPAAPEVHAPVAAPPSAPTHAQVRKTDDSPVPPGGTE